MKHLTIFVPEGENNLSSIVGTYKLFSRANALWKEKNNENVFEIQLAGLSDQVDFYEGLFSVKPHTSISKISKTDLIIIPSLNHNYPAALSLNEALVPWLEKKYKQGAEIASICTGAFLLAASGMLDGKSCSTHWSAAEDFRNRFPKVNLQTDQLITYEQGIYTNGGAYSFLNLIIYLIEKYFDRQTAIYCSKIFQIEPDRKSQSVFTMFRGQKQHDDEVVKEVQTYLEQNFREKISMEELSSRFSVGRRNFDRRFIKATGNTPIEYLQRIKVESAKKSLETSRKTVSEIMYEVGYSDVKAFREVFRKFTGMSPVEYKGRYSRNSVM